MRSRAEKLVPLFLTEEKINVIKNELLEIETIILPEIRKRMAAAYEDGDIPENNPFITANEDLQEAMKRRNDLRKQLARAKLFKPHKERDILHLGSTCTIKVGGETLRITLVSSEEANPTAGKISIDSPLGSALLARLPGETVEFTTPSGTQKVSIL